MAVRGVSDQDDELAVSNDEDAPLEDMAGDGGEDGSKEKQRA
jgi:hypothetical protein